MSLIVAPLREAMTRAYQEAKREEERSLGSKLDMTQAWNRAVALLGSNRDVLAGVAGVFFFLPNAIAALVMPQPAQAVAQGPMTDPADIEVALAQVTAYYAEIWWVFVLIAVVQAIGVLGLLALLTDRNRPTVAEALSFGVKALLPYLVTQVFIVLLMGLVALLLVGTGALINPVAGAIMVFVALPVLVYMWVKLSLVSPVIGIERQMNPVAALVRSWRLTKGNTLRLFTFYMLLVIALLVLSIVASMVLGALTLLGEELGRIAGALISGLVNMAIATVMLAVLAAVHRQLAGPDAEAVADTFG